MVEDISRHSVTRKLGRRVRGSDLAAARTPARDRRAARRLLRLRRAVRACRASTKVRRATARCRRSSAPRIASIRTIELYGNWGRGFHSNDARGVVNTATPVQGLSKGTGEEVGARFELGNFNITTTYWWLELDSELKFVGDSNSVEPGAATRRRGYEVVGFWRPLPWLAIDAVWTGSRARYVDSPDGVLRRRRGRERRRARHVAGAQMPGKRACACATSASIR